MGVAVDGLVKDMCASGGDEEKRVRVVFTIAKNSS